MDELMLGALCVLAIVIVFFLPDGISYNYPKLGLLAGGVGGLGALGARAVFGPSVLATAGGAAGAIAGGTMYIMGQIAASGF